MEILETIDSTQLEAKRQIEALQIITEKHILALEQTAGISTKKNVPWITKKGDLNLTSIFYQNEVKKNGNFIIEKLLFCAGLAMFDCIKSIDNNLNAFLKWPNDILILSKKDNLYKKVSGILAEIYKNHCLIGIGCNLISHPNKTEHFKATDLLEETGIKIDCIKFGEKLIEKLKNNIKILQQYGFEPIKEKWKKNAYMIGKTLILRDNKKVLFEDIDDNGYIIAKRLDNGEQHIIISSDEVIGGEM